MSLSDSIQKGTFSMASYSGGSGSHLTGLKQVDT